MNRMITAGLVSAGVVAMVAACGGTSAPQGYNNPQTLARSVLAQVNDGGNLTQDRVVCNPMGSGKFQCQDNYGNTYLIQVAANGKSWAQVGS
jgi:hypothetical protein